MEYICFEVADGIGTLILNCLDCLNGMTTRMLVETRDCLQQVAERIDIWVLVFIGEGCGFCSGADLKGRVAGEADMPADPHYFNVPVLLHEMF